MRVRVSRFDAILGRSLSYAFRTHHNPFRDPRTWLQALCRRYKVHRTVALISVTKAALVSLSLQISWSISQSWGPITCRWLASRCRGTCGSGTIPGCSFWSCSGCFLSALLCYSKGCIRVFEPWSQRPRTKPIEGINVTLALVQGPHDWWTLVAPQQPSEPRMNVSYLLRLARMPYC